MFTTVFLIIIKIIDLNLTKIMVRTHYLDYMIQNQDLKSKIFLRQENNFESYEFSPAIEKYLKIVRSGRASKEAYQFLALSFLTTANTI